MRLVRVLLLVLLAALLPVRGVMAAALPCPPHAGAAGHGHAPSTAGEHVHATVDTVPASPGHHHDGTPGKDTCNLCSACCSVPPVPCAAPAMPGPAATAQAVFPALAAPAPCFQSEGLERPPRSI